jgi:L-threonylcarbamoyladenylate synthase
MDILAKQEALLRKEEIIKKIKKGAIFIHPTDTIYGIGCNALNEEAVKKIRNLKDRHNTPFSVWAPSREWIKRNCKTSSNLDKWIKELPGAYTLIAQLKNQNCVAPNVNPKEKQTLGIRIPAHWFHEIIEELNLPIITTSANKTGKTFMTSLDDLDSEIETDIEFIVYDGERKAGPSKIIHLEKEKVIERLGK